MKKVKAVKRLKSRGKKEEGKQGAGYNPQTKKQWEAGKRRKKAAGRPEKQ